MMRGVSADAPVTALIGIVRSNVARHPLIVVARASR
jgi:hypothetical protein